MVVRSESRDRLELIQLCPELPASPGPTAPPLSPDGRQLNDEIKKGGKRLFPLYDNLSKTVKRHREKSRERDKSRDRVKQRDKLRLKEEQEAVADRNNANVSGEPTREQLEAEQRGREKTKEKRRFYQRDKSKDKKKNKHKTKEKDEKGQGEPTVDVTAARLSDAVDLPRPSSTYSFKEDAAIYGSVEVCSTPSSRAAQIQEDRSAAVIKSSDQVKAFRDSPSALSGPESPSAASPGPSGLTPNDGKDACRPAPSAAGPTHGQTPAPAPATSPSSSPGTRPSATEDSVYGDVAGNRTALYGDVAGSRTGLYGDVAGSKTGLYGDVAGSRTGLYGDVAGSRTGLYGDVAGSRTGLYGDVVGSRTGLYGDVAGSRTGLYGDVAGSRTGLYGDVAGSRAGLYESPLGRYSSLAARYLARKQPARRPSEHDYETFESVLGEAKLTVAAPVASPDEDPPPSKEATSAAASGDTLALAKEGASELTGAVVPAAASEPDFLPEDAATGRMQRLAAAAAGAVVPAPLNQSDAADTEAGDSPDTSAVPAAQPRLQPSAAPAPAVECAVQNSSDKAKGSRKFLSFHSRAAGKTSAKRSFLSTLLRSSDAASDAARCAAAEGDVSKVKSLPAKYRDLFRDRRIAPGSERSSGRAETAAARKPDEAAPPAEQPASPPTPAEPEVVEIELPGVFGPSQMRASLRITLKNSAGSRGAECAGAGSSSAAADAPSAAGMGSRQQGRARAKPASKRPSEQRLSVAIPPETVAALTSKFNALIQASTSAESSPSPTGVKTFNLGSITLDKSGNVSKSSSFRRTEAARVSSRRRLAASQAERTHALLSKASAALRDDATGRAAVSSKPSSKPSSRASSRSASFRRQKGGGSAGAGGAPKPASSATGRDVTRLSGCRRSTDARTAGGRPAGLAWTSAVRAEQKSAGTKATAVVHGLRGDGSGKAGTASEKPGPSTVEASVKSPNKSKSSVKEAVGKKSECSESTEGKGNASDLSANKNEASSSKSVEATSKKSVSTASGDKKESSATKPNEQSADKKERKVRPAPADQKTTGVPKSGRDKMDVSKIHDRELRKLTNTGTVAKTSELWLKRAQSSNELGTVKKNSAAVTRLSLKNRNPVSEQPSKTSGRTELLSGKNSKMTSSESCLMKSSSSIASLKSDVSPGQHKEVLNLRCKSSAKQITARGRDDDAKVSDTTGRSQSDVKSGPGSSPTATPHKAKEENKITPVKEQTESKEASRASTTLKQKTDPKPGVLIDSHLYGVPSVVGFHQKTKSTLFENRLYGETFPPIKNSVHKHVSATAPTQKSRLPITPSARCARVDHPPVGKTLSLKSLPPSPCSRVKEAIHRFEAPTPARAAAAPMPAEAVRKAATLPSRLPAPARAPGFYESIWDGRREYRPNESFLWNGSSQVTSCGESVGSSVSASDTASSASDAGSMPEEEAAVRARSTLWRRLGMPRAAPPAAPAAEYEPAGGSSSSGTVTYENGSDPGYEHISGDSCTGYEQIGARYERIGGAPPSETTSAGYETLSPPSETSTLCYDDCVVPARLAVVSEHQAESLGYLDRGTAQYEDIGGAWAARGLLEGTDLKPTPLQTFEEEPEMADESEGGPQTVNSYQLTEFGSDQVAAPAPQQVSLPSTPRDRLASDRDTGGDWTDIDADGEQEASDDTEGSAESPIVVTRPHFVRLRNRSRRFSKTRGGRRSWSQSLRNLNGEEEYTEGPWRHTLTDAWRV
ncbi:serine/arginine repetitive matrix protein 2-like [Pollicipes pollicipes]|uniref:serine/arginine repetitive matrix protein 2-like n=1 Tax=Pollicipes pollicipes TaxID=41117 RepID=UPI001884B404|nr:serine/arginine repetitive matrix protein 2-like [Pollicipes pollicipes]